jgi:hypothetical protein
MAVAAAVVSVSLCLAPACGGSPSDPSPSPIPSPSAFAISSVVPPSGPEGVEVRIAGNGFVDGATVTVGGVAVAARVASNALIFVTIPVLSTGGLDVVVTNPDGQRATSPRAFTFVRLEITDVSPNAGWVGFQFFVFGTGMLPGARLSIDGATAGTAGTGPSIVAIAPNHSPGPVDLVVTNPGGASVTRAGGFTYLPAPTLTVSPTVIAPGGQLQVSYVVPLTSGLDWIGLYRLNADNIDYLAYQYIGGLLGTVTFTAPAQPGQYQFRYLPLDGYLDYARTETVTVTAGTTLAGAYDFADRFLRRPPSSSGPRPRSPVR